MPSKLLGDKDGQFNAAIGVAVDGDGNVFVSEENQRVQKFACHEGERSYSHAWSFLGALNRMKTVVFVISCPSWLGIVPRRSDLRRGQSLLPATQNRIGRKPRRPVVTAHRDQAR